MESFSLCLSSYREHIMILSYQTICNNIKYQFKLMPSCPSINQIRFQWNLIQQGDGQILILLRLQITMHISNRKSNSLLSKCMHYYIMVFQKYMEQDHLFYYIRIKIVFLSFINSTSNLPFIFKIVLIKELMNCYLKISYLNKHKKYRYQKDKPINFQQIRRELSPSPNSTLQCIAFSICPSNNLNQNASQQANLNKLTEKALSQYLKNANFQEHETIKIKIVEESNKIKEDTNQNDNKNDSFSIPLSIQRVRSKSEELNLQTQKFIIQTDTIQVTQEFLCNSNFQFGEKVNKPSQFDWIFQDLQSNQRKIKQLQFRKRLTNIPNIYKKVQAIIHNQ